MNSLKLFLTALTLLTAMVASAYGTLGHYTIGQIAQQQLDADAEVAITALLKNGTLPMISNWADIQKSNPDFRETSNWHYNNFEPGLTRAQFDSIAMTTNHGQNIYQTNQLIAQLQANPDDTTALLMLVHLVQDLHCPMHFGRPNDRGGNDVPIKWFDKTTNLHSIWDTELIEAAKLSYTEYADHLLRQYDYPEQDFNTQMILDWAWQNYQLAEQIYNDIDLTNKSYQYMYKYRPLLDHQDRKSVV